MSKIKDAKIISKWKKCTRKMRSKGANKAMMVAFPNGTTKHVWLVDGKWVDWNNHEYFRGK